MKYPMILASLFAATLPAQTPEHRPAVELAICLDTSGSMDGLINAARQNLWAVVNDLALARPAPRLKVALLTFGNDGHPKETGWVRVETPFTEDLDLVSQKLFALTTNGGTEYVGRVLRASLDQLAWTDTAQLKLILVAGNEAADQDREVDFRTVAKRAIESGIVVNSIYCGNAADALAPVWREVATLAEGQFASIDQDHGVVAITTPFDAELTALGTKVNATYLPYGARGKEGAANQIWQDSNAASLNGATAAQRAATKCSTLYTCGWDLVDACRDPAFKLETVKVEELPEPMRTMTTDQRRQHVAEMLKQREEIQKQVTELGQKREAFVVAELKKRAIDTSRSFDHAIKSAIRAQAQARGIVFAAPEAKTPAVR
jgi:hypothetical protein